MAKKLPYISFFTGDWTRDTRILSLQARAVWMDMLCLMHDGDRRGYLSRAGSPVTTEQLARFCGCNVAEVESAIAEIMSAGVGSRTEDGTIFSRRMLRDEKNRKAASVFGRAGGNPKLKQFYALPGFIYAIRRASDRAVKIGASTNPSKRCANRKGSLKGEECTLLKIWPVTSMGKAEVAMHEHFAEKCAGGEWFRLSVEDLDSIDGLLTLKGLLNDSNNGTQKLPLEYGDGNRDEFGIVSASSPGGGAGEGRRRFVPPTVAEVAAYCAERQNHVDAEMFVNHYTSNGWRVGRNAMRNWKAAVCTWEKNDFTREKAAPAARSAGLAEAWSAVRKVVARHGDRLWKQPKNDGWKSERMAEVEKRQSDELQRDLDALPPAARQAAECYGWRTILETDAGVAFSQFGKIFDGIAAKGISQ